MLKRFTNLALWLLCLALVAQMTAPACAQSIISGQANVTVTDSTGAVLPKVPVTLTSVETGQATTKSTDDSGFVPFPLLRPGDYKVLVSSPGFAPVTKTATVSLGKVTLVSIQLKVKGTSEIVDVSEVAPLLQTEDANITFNYDRQQIDFLPSPGGDLTNYALSAPGAVLSTGAGWGNFTAFGLPGTARMMHSVPPSSRHLDSRGARHLRFRHWPLGCFRQVF